MYACESTCTTYTHGDAVRSSQVVFRPQDDCRAARGRGAQTHRSSTVSVSITRPRAPSRRPETVTATSSGGRRWATVEHVCGAVICGRDDRRRTGASCGQPCRGGREEAHAERLQCTTSNVGTRRRGLTTTRQSRHEPIVIPSVRRKTNSKRQLFPEKMFRL